MYIYIYIYTTYTSRGRRNHKRDIINRKSENLNCSRHTADECNHRVALKIDLYFSLV